MIVPRSVFYGFQVVLLLIVLAIFVVGAYFIINTNADDAATDAAIKADITRMQGTATTYHARLQYFEGICAAIGGSNERICHEAEDGYAIEARLSDNTYYCADSTGFRGVAKRSKGPGNVCAR